MTEATGRGRRAGSPARLMRRLPLPRWHLPVLVGLSAATAATIIAQAELVAAAVAEAETGVLPWLAGALVLRALCTGLTRGVTGQVSARVRYALRHGIINHATPHPVPATEDTGTAPVGNTDGSRVTLLTNGVESVDPYLTSYIPQLVNAAVVPLAVLGWLAYTDLASALIILVTLPLLPLLGALVGWHTADATRRRWRAMDRLGGHFLDALRGLATLRLFGRDTHQVAEVRRTAHEHRAASMSVLRIAFLSAMVLELVAALAVALVAVPMGMRLLEGSVSLQVGLVVLLLTPEAFLPLRALGSAFHTATDGVSAADRALALGTPAAPTGPRPTLTTAARIPDPARSPIQLDAVTVHFPDRADPALDRVTLDLDPGHNVVVGGPSGAGKSTLLRLVLGLVTPSRGRVLVDGADLATLDMDAWRREVAWVPQHPHMFADTLAANIALRPELPGSTPDRNHLHEALDAAHAGDLAIRHGLDAGLGATGLRLSEGQRQRVAIARAHYRAGGLVLLDEPTTRLDLATEAVVHTAIRTLGERRRTIVVAHSPALLDTAERLVWLSDGRVVPDGPAVPESSERRGYGTDLAPLR